MVRYLQYSQVTTESYQLNIGKGIIFTEISDITLSLKYIKKERNALYMVVASCASMKSSSTNP